MNMRTLSFDYAAAKPLVFPATEITKLSASTVYPLPSLEEIKQAGFTTLQSGEIPSCSNYDDAVVEFLGSPMADTWRVTYHPATPALFPCSPQVDHNLLVERLKAEGLSVTFISDKNTGQSGFMVTKTGRDFSDHIATAYVLAGHVPPHQTLLDALRRHVHSPMKAKLIEAARQHTAHWQEVCEAFSEMIEQDLDLGIVRP